MEDTRIKQILHLISLKQEVAEKTALPNRSSLTICGKGKPQVRTQRSVFLRKLPKKSGLVR